MVATKLSVAGLPTILLLLWNRIAICSFKNFNSERFWTNKCNNCQVKDKFLLIWVNKHAMSFSTQTKRPTSHAALCTIKQITWAFGQVGNSSSKKLQQREKTRWTKRELTQTSAVHVTSLFVHLSLSALLKFCWLSSKCKTKPLQKCGIWTLSHLCHNMNFLISSTTGSPLVKLLVLALCDTASSFDDSTYFCHFCALLARKRPRIVS